MMTNVNETELERCVAKMYKEEVSQCVHSDQQEVKPMTIYY